MPVSRNMAISLAVVVALLTPLAWYLLAYDYGPVAAPSVSAGGKGEAARFSASGDEVELRAGQPCLLAHHDLVLHRSEGDLRDDGTVNLGQVHSPVHRGSEQYTSIDGTESI